MSIDKAKLKALAKSATQGQWVFDGGTVNDWFNGEYSMEWMPNGEDCEDGTNANWKADAKYIAAANPETMLALLAEIEQLKIEVETLKKSNLWWVAEPGNGLVRCVTDERYRKFSASVRAKYSPVISVD